MGEPLLIFVGLIVLSIVFAAGVNWCQENITIKKKTGCCKDKKDG